MSLSCFSPAFSFVRSCGLGARVGIVGSRDYPFPELVRLFVAGLPAGSVVVSGGGGVVDLAAWVAACECGLEASVFPACWSLLGRAAGPVRNQELVSSGLCCLVVFLSSLSEPSPGSASAVRLALEAGVPVFLFGAGGGFPPPGL